MLQQMRKGAGSWVAKGLMILLVASFGLWGVESFIRGNYREPPIAEVGDVKVTRVEYANAVRQDIQRLQQQVGGSFDLEQAKRLGLTETSLNQLVERALFDQEAERLGLRIPLSAIQQEIVNAPVFRNSTGQYDRLAVENFMRSNNLTEGQLISMLRRDMLRAQLVNALTAGVDPAPAAVVDALYRYRQERRVADFVVLKDADAPLPADPDDATLAKFHKDNEARFSSPERRDLTWAILSPADFAKNEQVTEEEIKDEYDSRAASYTKPELRTVEQAVYRTEAEAKAAKAMADAGTDFAAVAEKTLKLKASDLSLGKVGKQQLPAAIATPVFQLNQGQVSDPIMSPLGWHLVRVTAIEPSSSRTLAEASAEIKGYLALRHAADRLVTMAQKIEDRLAGGSSVEEALEGLDLKINRATVDTQGRDPKGNQVDLPKLQRFFQAAFTTPQGNDPRVEESGAGDGSFFIVKVEKILPPALRPLDEIKAEVVAAWKSDQRAKVIEQRANEMAEKLRAGGDFTALASAAKAKVEVSLPFTRANQNDEPRLPGRLVSELFEGSAGTAAAARSAQNDGYVAARLVRVEPASPTVDARLRDTITQSLAGGMAEDIMATYKERMERRFPVTINRTAADAAL